MSLECTAHALERLAQRGITLEEADRVLSRHVTGPLPGDNGNLIFEGYTSLGRRLRIVVSSDRAWLITAMWR